MDIYRISIQQSDLCSHADTQLFETELCWLLTIKVRPKMESPRKMGSNKVFLEIKVYLWLIETTTFNLTDGYIYRTSIHQTDLCLYAGKHSFETLICRIMTMKVIPYWNYHAEWVQLHYSWR